MKVPIVKAVIFLVVMYGCESWTIKKAEHWRIDAFELCCWRRLLRVPWTARRSNQSILKEINPEYSLEGLMLKLKLQYFGHLMWWVDLLKKNPDSGKDWGQKEKGETEDEMVGWHYWLNGHEFEQTPGDGEDQGSLACCSPWDLKESDTTHWLTNNHHVSGIMISVKIVLKDSWNIVLRTDEKLEQVSSLGEVTDPSVIWENLLVYFSEPCIYAFSELNRVPPNDSQVLTSSTCECDHIWKQSLCWCH